MTQPPRSFPRRSRRRAKAPGHVVRPISTEPIREQTRMRRQQPPPRRSPWSTPVLAGGLVAIGIAVVAAVFLIGGGRAPSASPGTSVGAHGQSCPTSQPAALTAGQTRTVTIKTTEGDIVIRVKADLSPIAAGNFVALASCGFYDGIVFHRTPTLGDGTPFVIQGGDPLGNGSGGPGYTIKDEPVTTTYKRGTVAMARSQAPDSQGSQFFIVLSDGAAGPLTSANNYAIFGEVVAGMAVADTIYKDSGGEELPTNPIEMVSVSVASP